MNHIQSLRLQLTACARIWRIGALVLFVSLPAAFAQQVPFDCQRQSAGVQGCDSGTKGGWLAMMMVSAMKESAANAARQQSYSMFDNWFSWIFGKAKIPPAPLPPVGTSLTDNVGGQGQAAVSAPQVAAAPTQPHPSAVAPAPPSTPATSAQQALAVDQAVNSPMLAISVVFLQGPQPNAPPHATHGSVDMRSQEGQPMSFSVYNNDVFALYFTPSTPGMVKLVSIDSKKVEELDLYAVLPGRVNRLPREGQGGIIVDSNVGTETLRIVFEPCLPEAFKDDPVAQAFVGRLQRCNLQIAQAGARGMGPPVPGKATSKGMALTMPRNEPKIGLIGTDKSYSAGNVITYDITVHHYANRI